MLPNASRFHPSEAKGRNLKAQPLMTEGPALLAPAFLSPRWGEHRRNLKAKGAVSPEAHVAGATGQRAGAPLLELEAEKTPRRFVGVSPLLLVCYSITSFSVVLRPSLSNFSR